jgi:glycosyltransferase involved in cell wall biosynthesis
LEWLFWYTFFPSSERSGQTGRDRKRIMRSFRTAYVVLWFPKPTETFIFHEVLEMVRSGLPVSVYTLYGRFPRHLSPYMESAPVSIERLGIPYLKTVVSDLLYWHRRKPRLVRKLFGTVPLRRWCDLEAAGENCWAFLCGFHLARRFEEESIEHIHAPWANGPATAAWVASKLTGIPFSFAAHAADIYPPDGALKEKIRDAILVRTVNRANVVHLRKYAPGCENKIRVVYCGQPGHGTVRNDRLTGPSIKILALGRFVPKKGFEVLIHACAILRDRGLEFSLNLGGDGALMGRLMRLTEELNLEQRVNFPGFIIHDRVPEFLNAGDVFVMSCIVDPTGDRDGIPIVITEALRHGLPVVATDVSGIPEVIMNGSTGLLVPPGDPHAIADAILKLTRERGWALKMAERGRSFVLEEFDLHRNCQALMQVFDREVPTASRSCR